MFVIVENEYVILGPMEWRPTFFQNTLLDDLGIEFGVPHSNIVRRPIQVTDTVRILAFDGYTHPSINNKIQEYEGPYWNFTEDSATGYFTAVDKSVSTVKGELKNSAASRRWEKETSGLKFTVQDINVWLYTDREKRTAYSNGVAGQWKVQLAGSALLMRIAGSNEPQVVEEEVDGPAGESWITLTSEDLTAMTAAIQSHVQDAFNWEAAKVAEIDSKETLADLDAVEI